jgi:hypothetical protein
MRPNPQPGITIEVNTASFMTVSDGKGPYAPSPGCPVRPHFIKLYLENERTRNITGDNLIAVGMLCAGKPSDRFYYIAEHLVDNAAKSKFFPGQTFRVFGDDLRRAFAELDNFVERPY